MEDWHVRKELIIKVTTNETGADLKFMSLKRMHFMAATTSYTSRMHVLLFEGFAA